MNTKLLLLVGIMTASMGLTACDSNTENAAEDLSDAQEEVQDASEGLNEAAEGEAVPTEPPTVEPEAPIAEPEVPVVNREPSSITESEPSIVEPDLGKSNPPIAEPEAPIAEPEAPTAELEPDVSGVNKTISDGSHLNNLPMSRDFIMDSNNRFKSIDANFQAAGANGSKKIFSIKPTGDTQPRAVILLDTKIVSREFWKFWEYNWNVRRKNLEICKGFTNLPTVETLELEGRQTGNPLTADRKNHVITYMPTRGRNRNNLPSYPEDCKTFISKGYDYDASSEELSFILENNELGKSPYLAVYESSSSPYSSMSLSLGELSPESINVLAAEWPELIMKVYKHGDSIDPTIGIALMLARDGSLQQAQNDSMWNNIKIGVSGAVCGGAFASSTVTLNVLLATPACTNFVKEAALALGYELPII